MSHELYFSPTDDPRHRPDGPPVRVRWLGTAGFSIEHDGFVILIDPYLTRAPLSRLLSFSLRPDVSLIPRFTPRADAILVGHTHFDHALDVPAIAHFTGAKVFGSSSAVNLCRAASVPEDRLLDLELSTRGRCFDAEVGPFRLRIVPSCHSRFLLGSVPFPGQIPPCDCIPSRVDKFRCGAVFAFDIRVANRRIFHLGSADLIDAHACGCVDLLLLCAAGWQSTAHFVPRVLRSLNPAKILLSHWDDFTTPLVHPPRVLPSTGLPQLRDQLYNLSRRDLEVGALPPLGDMII